MTKHITLLIVCLALITSHNASAQTSLQNLDTTIGPKPVIKIENLSPDGHCDNLEFTFIAPWADHFEIGKRRSDTAWIKDNKSLGNWTFQKLRPHVTGLIYKKLDEQGAYQFVIRAYKANRYRESDTITRPPCITTAATR